MRGILLTGAAVLALAMPARADNITLTATADGTLVDTISSGGMATLDVNNVAFGPAFNLNSLTLGSQASLAAGEVLSTNTLDVAALASGTHSLVLDITATGLTGIGALQSFLSSFSVTGLTSGWTVSGETLINGSALANGGPFGGTGSGTSINSALETNPFTAEAKYTITSSGTGDFNGGIDINAASVPGPVVGAGVPGLVAGLLMLLGLGRGRRRA